MRENSSVGLRLFDVDKRSINVKDQKFWGSVAKTTSLPTKMKWTPKKERWNGWPWIALKGSRDEEEMVHFFFFLSIKDQLYLVLLKQRDFSQRVYRFFFLLKKSSLIKKKKKL
jgi:hypothetical protein